MDVSFGPYRLKRQERVLTGPDGAIDLSARSFDILCALLERSGEVIGKDALFAAVWPGVVVEENTLQVHVSALRKALAPGMIVTVHGRGYKYAGPVPGAVEGGAIAAKSSSTPGTGPVIAVLPFENLSGDPEQQYFSDGITQDIMDRLTRFRVLSVIGIDSSFMERSAVLDIDAIRTSLGADFLVSGNVRRSGSRIRISARLADASTRKAIWAEHYDRPIADLFEVQDEVAEMVAATVTRQLEIEITGRTSHRHPANLTCYELTLLGIWHYFKQTREGTTAAIDCCERALAIDPGYWQALEWLGNSKCLRYFSDFDRVSLAEGVGLLARATEHDPTSARGFVGYSVGVLWLDGVDAARAAIDRALHLNPGEPYCNAQRACVAIFEGQCGEAKEWLRRGLKLNPNPPLWFAEYAAKIAFQEARYRDAIPGLLPLFDNASDMMYLIACYGYLGERDKAQAIIDRFAAQGRMFDFFAAAAREPYRDPELRERLIAGLKLALQPPGSNTAGR